MSKATTHQIHVEKNDSWETPQELFEQACVKYNVNPTLDVCATAQNAKFPKYYTINHNALSQEWNESFFMNPPYSEIDTWMAKAYEQHKKYNVDGIILVFAKTGTQWWHRYVEGKADVHFIQGRIRFLLNGIEPRYCKYCKIRSTQDNSVCPKCENKIPKSSPTYDSAWVIFRREESYEEELAIA